MIELFKQPNINWMGKAKYFYALSGILLLAGWTSIIVNGGLRYGIDFKGGTNVDVRFAQPPNVDKLRSGLVAQGLGNTEIQSISDISNPSSNEVLIFVEGKTQDDSDLDASRVKVLNALNATYGVASSNKPDFNAATPSSLAAFLSEKDPLFLSVSAGDRYQQLAKKILDYRDKVSNGVLTTCTPPSGAYFPFGQTVVTCIATNSCNSNQCTFTVTVNFAAEDTRLHRLGRGRNASAQAFVSRTSAARY